MLILSADSVAAALVGALVETLGYLVRFHRSAESLDSATPRPNPSIALIDCADPTLLDPVVLSGTMMRGISVLILGSEAAIASVSALAAVHELGSLILPASSVVDEPLQQAIQNLC